MSLMRSVLLAASENRFLRERATKLGFVRAAVTRFMPGEDAQSALDASRQQGAPAVLTHLGENLESAQAAEEVTQALPRRARPHPEVRARRRDLRQAHTARPRFLEGGMRAAPADALRAREGAEQLGLDRHGVHGVHRRHARDLSAGAAGLLQHGTLRPGVPLPDGEGPGTA